MKALLFTTAIIFSLIRVNAQQTAERINYAHQYNPMEELSMRFVSGLSPSGEYEIMIQLEHREVENASYAFEFYGISDFTADLDANRLEPLQTRLIAASANISVHTFRFSPNISSTIICKVTSDVTGLSYFENVEITRRPFPSLLIGPGEIPVLQSYINEGRYDISAAVPLTIDHYDHDFPVALPPMTTREPEVPRTLTLTGSFSMDSSYNHIFSDQGLYIGKDGDGEIRLVYRVEGLYYPEYVTLETLIEPLVYITTREERAGLIRNKEDKKAFDRFWLEMTGKEENARWVIRNYYRRVAEANELFTTFKEGWKTDRGMIYIVFGPPDEVIRKKGEEFWAYKGGNDLPAITFRFSTQVSPYAPRLYTLSRSEAMADNWIKAVKTWRNGTPINENQ